MNVQGTEVQWLRVQGPIYNGWCPQRFWRHGQEFFLNILREQVGESGGNGFMNIGKDGRRRSDV